MKIAAAQTIPRDGNITGNLNDHYRLIELAADNGVQFIVFPEMSITGYQRQGASALSFTAQDSRLDRLRELAEEKKVIIVAGAPIHLETGLHIGSFIIFPDRSVSLYTKQFLHDGEEEFYTPDNTFDPQIKLEDETISLAICADIENPHHPANAAGSGCTLYVAGIFYTPDGIALGHTRLAEYAKQRSMNVLMSNYGGSSWGLEAGGGSAFWTNTGLLKASLEGRGQGLLIAAKENVNWNCTIIETT